ncbi:hypothetical protein K443DRAFT_389973 [Laccaria amethystina LaAM-08-1]|uniref:Uncharacterized protein n=1 Tax=Laccaria amethystina LaAM-08-1 TaxID=1095629 RepID=A0A0C9XBC3_9AGAR|nr:hypothetical protein K443DRAFT_389973 [Laccaria amethystina LaAM-08-1]
MHHFLRPSHFYTEVAMFQRGRWIRWIAELWATPGCLTAYVSRPWLIFTRRVLKFLQPQVLRYLCIYLKIDRCRKVCYIY